VVAGADEGATVVEATTVVAAGDVAATVVRAAMVVSTTVVARAVVGATVVAATVVGATVLTPEKGWKRGGGRGRRGRYISGASHTLRP